MSRRYKHRHYRILQTVNDLAPLFHVRAMASWPEHMELQHLECGCLLGVDFAEYTGIVSIALMRELTEVMLVLLDGYSVQHANVLF